jgi:phosphoglycolate phosphatase-like HAD superfamily hydrolase
MSHHKVLVLDIDDTLANYKRTWLDFIADRTGVVFEDLDEVKQACPPGQYKELKEEYRASGRKRTIELLNDGIPSMLRSVAQRGWKIAIVSSRPAYTNQLVASDTIIWLLRNRITSDYMYFTKEKHELIRELFSDCERCVVVEDELEFAEAIAEEGFDVLLVTELDCTPVSPRITRISSAVQAISWVLAEDNKGGGNRGRDR